MVTVTALVRAALGWQIKADGEEKIGQEQANSIHRKVFRGWICAFVWTDTLFSLCVCLATLLLHCVFVCVQGYINRGTCSYPELTSCHVLTSA